MIIKIEKIVFIIVFLISCNRNEEKQARVIEDSFLLAIDTLAYRTFSLRPISPDDTVNYKKSQFLGMLPLLKIQDSTYSFMKFRELSLSIIKERGTGNADTLKMYVELINKWKPQKKLLKLSKYLPSKMDKYVLSFDSEKLPENLKLVGYLSFSEVLMDIKNNLAVYVLTSSIGEKSGIEKLLLLKKDGNRFRVFQEIELVIW